MGLQSYTVSFTVDDGVSWTALTNVQNIQFSIGRQAQLDQIKSSYGSFEMRYPTGYASPITALVSGTVIRIQNTTGTPYTVFTGRIDNVIAQYGIPYAGGVGQADYLNVTFEGAFAIAGRMQGNNYAMAAGTIVSQMSAASTQTGIFLTFDGSSSLAATTVSTTWGDWINRVCQSTNSRIWDSYDTKNISVINPFSSYVNTVNFSDTANDSTNQVYNQINFDSLADNFYTQVTVTPESFGAATVTKVGASAPFRTYQTNTLNASTLQASDYASYLLSNYDTPRFAISSFSCMAEAQASFQLDKIGGSNILAQSPGTQIGVTFRGTTYQCIIEGVTVSATPAGAMFTYYVSGADLNAYLILDNATFGVLDSNKLGY
jgi:peroxiredoxin family protein